MTSSAAGPYGFDHVSTPFGDATAVFSDDGLALFDLSEAGDASMPWVLDGISRRLGAVPDHEPGIADELAGLIDRYFEGEPVRFADHVVIDWRLTDGFHRNALQVVNDIEWGQTLSYGEVAVLAGHPGAARAVGTACRLTPLSLVVPVHRVIRSDGTVGQYGAHPERKQFLLDLERQAAAP